MDENQVFFMLDYTHEELEAMLDKVHNGILLTKAEYTFLRDLMGAVDDNEEEETPINPDDFITKDNIIEYVGEALKGIGVANKQDLDDLLRTFEAAHSQDMQNVLNDIGTVFEEEMTDMEENLKYYFNERESFDTLEDMFNYDEEVPIGFLTYCKEDGKRYEYLGEGNWSEFKTSINVEGGDGGTIELPTDLVERLEKLESMLDILPTYAEPVVSANINKSSFIEAGVPETISITPTFAQNDAGNLTRCVIKKGEEILYDGAEIQNVANTVTLSHNNRVTYTITIEYADGPIKETELGNPDPNKNNIKAGSKSYSFSVRALAASYVGVISGTEVTEETIETLTKKGYDKKGNTVNYALTDQRSIYMYPKSFGTLTSIKDANGFEYINSYTLSTMTFNNVDYNIYVMKDPTTIIDLKQVFS